MNALILAGALLAPQPLELPDLAALFRDEHAAVIRDIRVEIQADLEQRGVRFLGSEGALQRILEDVVVIQAGFAAR